MQLEKIYKDTLVKHYRELHGSGLLTPFNVNVKKISPTCGDEIILRLHSSSEVDQNISYEIAGCTISQCSSSIMFDLCNNKTNDEIRNLYQDVVAYLTNTMTPASDSLGELAAFGEVRKHPSRIKCALLSWQALMHAIETNKECI
jgi:nitrogen fixation NifU-like protein